MVDYDLEIEDAVFILIHAKCDCDYLMYFYKTGEKRPFRSFWVEGALC